MTIACDFDGVIHRYSRGWHDGTIYDPPVPGALDGLRALMERDAVFIHTTRDVSQVASWLLDRGLPVRVGHDGPFWNERGRLLVTNRKLAATAYLDDRAVRFTTWDQALADLDVPRPEPVVSVHAAPDLSPAAADALGALVDVAKEEMQHRSDVTIRPTAYTVSVLPPTHRWFRVYALTVERDGTSDLWKVRANGRALWADGSWGHDGACRCLRPHPPSRFPLPEAIARAEAAAPTYTFNGRTAADLDTNHTTEG